MLSHMSNILVRSMDSGNIHTFIASAAQDESHMTPSQTSKESINSAETCQGRTIGNCLIEFNKLI